uniref:Integral membrane protein GPR137-like n=1 Tax=Gouania willdenowi TaxID=441366 RepID=A0A8C5D8R3_GOUWI
MEAPAPPNSSTPPVPVPIHPAVAPSVQRGFTILYTALYAGLFLVVYTQLWLLYFYRHKRWSYQSAFLFLCLLWASLRTTLFSFYFQNALEANNLPMAVYWLLYCLPVCLQFFTFSLINLYFTQVLLKVSEAYNSDMDRGLWLARCIYGTLSIIFLTVNVVCAVLGDRDRDGGTGELTWNLVLVRVIINDLLFIFDAVLLATLLMSLTRHSRSTSPYLISKGTTVCRTATLGAAVILLFASRACYNLTVLILSQNYQVESFNFNWYNVSDQTNKVPINNRILPRPYFFDDPQCSDDDSPVPWTRRLPSQPSWYASESAPLLFASNTADQSHQHHTFYSTPQN